MAFLGKFEKEGERGVCGVFYSVCLPVCLYDIGPTSTLQRIETVSKLTLRADMGVTYPHF